MRALAKLTCLAAALFLKPLRGLHSRLTDEKARLVGASQDHVKITVASALQLPIRTFIVTRLIDRLRQAM